MILLVKRFLRLVNVLLLLREFFTLISEDFEALHLQKMSVVKSPTLIFLLPFKNMASVINDRNWYYLKTNLLDITSIYPPLPLAYNNLCDTFEKMGVISAVTHSKHHSTALYL